MPIHYRHYRGVSKARPDITIEKEYVAVITTEERPSPKEWRHKTSGWFSVGKPMERFTLEIYERNSGGGRGILLLVSTKRRRMSLWYCNKLLILHLKCISDRKF